MMQPYKVTYGMQVINAKCLRWMAFLGKPYSRSQTREVKVYHRKTIWLSMQRHQIFREKIWHQHKFRKYQQFMLSYLARWIHNCIYAYMYKHLPVQGQSPPGHHPPGQSPPGQSPPRSSQKCPSDQRNNYFQCIFLNANFWIAIKISLEFVPKGPINNIPALVYIMAWRRPGDKPLSQPMVVRLRTHISANRPH